MVHASLFGSAARGDGDVSSDIDLFVVRPSKIDADDPVWRRQIDQLAESVRSWTGNHAGISEISDDQLRTLADERPRVIEDLHEDAIDLAGKDLREVMELR